MASALKIISKAKQPNRLTAQHNPILSEVVLLTGHGIRFVQT